MNEVFKNIYKIEVPLVNNPLKIINVFVIKGDERSLMIDTGFNNEEARTALMNGMDELNLKLDDTDIFLTHLHSDHSGLVSYCKTPKNKVFVSERDGIGINDLLSEEYWLQDDVLHKQKGYPDSIRIRYEDNPVYLYKLSFPVEFIRVVPGDILDYGGYNFEVIDIKGHTPASLGLYEPEKHLLFSGDLLLNKITPNIAPWDFKSDYLGDYLDSLKRVRELKIDKVFSAHRQEINDPYERIDQMFAHHERRLGIILDILGEGESTIYNIAAKMKWEFASGYFLEFPNVQKFFCTFEVFAHLIHLEELGKVKRIKTDDGVFIFSLI